MRTIPASFRLSAVLLAGLAVGACGGEGEEDVAAVPEAEVVEPAAPVAAPAAAPVASAALPAGVTPELVQAGQGIYSGAGICFTCHGPDGLGTALAPNLADQEWLWIDPADPDLLTQTATLIKTGVSQPKEHPAPMPAMGGAQLTEDQIQAVSAYVLSLGGVPQG